MKIFTQLCTLKSVLFSLAFFRSGNPCPKERLQICYFCFAHCLYFLLFLVYCTQCCDCDLSCDIWSSGWLWSASLTSCVSLLVPSFQPKGLEDPKAVPNMRPVLKLWLFLMEDLILSFQDCSCGWDYTICWCFGCQEFSFERVNSWALPEGSR